MTKATRKRMYDGVAKRNGKKFGLGRHERRRTTREHMRVQLKHTRKRKRPIISHTRIFSRNSWKTNELVEKQNPSLDILSLQDYTRRECFQ